MRIHTGLVLLGIPRGDVVGEFWYALSPLAAALPAYYVAPHIYPYISRLLPTGQVCVCLCTFSLSLSLSLCVCTWPSLWSVKLMYHYVVRHLSRNISLPVCLSPSL